MASSNETLQFSNYTILIVDDNPTNLRTTSDYLSQYGFEIAVARNGQIALNIAIHASPDIILLDVMLPEINGFEICQQLKINNSTKNIPVIFMTALARVEDKIKGFEAGGVDYLTKPLHYKEVLARVTTHLQLRDLTEHLEQKVEERTQKLLALNEKRKRTEEALKHSEELFSKAFHANPSGISITKASDGQYINVNQSFLNILGYQRDEIIGHTALELNIWQNPEERESVVTVLQEQGSIYQQEVHFQKKSGQTCHVLLSGEFFELQNEPHILGMVLDITKRKLAEAALKTHSEELESMVKIRTKELSQVQERLIRQEKLAILGQLAGGIGHELRNPLGVISNAVYFLQMVLNETTDTVKEYLDIISTRVNEAEKIVSDLLDLSRIRSAEKEAAQVSDLIDKALQRHPPPETIIVKANISTELPFIEVDSQQIGQVLANLLINAYQAMPQGGQIVIEAIVEQDQIRLSTSDTGVGMSTDVKNKVFEPLFTTKSKGIGLGLAVSRNLVEINGGEITVESTEGKGSTFIITLPLPAQNSIN